MNRLQKLLERQAELHRQAAALQQALQAQDTPMTAEQQAEHKKIIDGLAQVAQDIQAQQALDAAVAQGAQSAGRQTAPNTPANADPAQNGRGAQDREEAVEVDDIRAAMRTAGYLPRVEVLGPTRDMRRSHGFRSMGEFVNSVRRAATGQGVDRRLFGPEGAAQDGANPGRSQASLSTFTNETVAQDGGIAVPPSFAQGIWGYMFSEENFLLPRFSPATISGNRQIYAKDETTPWGSTGIRGEWLGEASTMTQRKPALDWGEVKAHKLGVLAPVTDEMMEDAPFVESHITMKAAEALNWLISDALINGSGVKQPLGILHSTNGALVTQAKESGQPADTIVAKNIAKMYARLVDKRNAFWLINPDAFPELVTMQLGDRPIWTPPSEGFKGAPSGALFGLPVLQNESCDTLGDAGDIVLVAPSGYLAVVKAGGLRFASSIHLWFDQGVNALRWTIRVGGQPMASAPITPPNSSVTRSHFVNLAVRN